jgi:two-component system cell cycle sensor histidine kinase/response regulator CckA
VKNPRRPTPPPVPAALLAAALQALDEGVLVARRGAAAGGLTILFANELFCTMTGYPAAALRGRRHGFLHGEKSDVARILDWQRTARPGQPFAGEGYLRRRNGGVIHAAWNFSVIPGGRDRAEYLVATYRDTTEKRRLQEALLHAQRLDAVGRLAGGVAHDFNNLLSVINGYCQIMAGQLAGQPQTLKGIEVIHRAGQKAAALTRQLLAFGRREPLKARVINLNRFVRSNAEILTRLLGDKGRLKIVLGRNVGQVRTNPAQFQQVLLNLVLNARDALRADGWVVLRTSRRQVRSGLNRRATDAPPGHYACLSVSDNGVGMDAETQRQLFEPFFTTKPEGEGTGLGLSLAYGVVQQSGGFINVTSELAAGATFEILLPATSARAEPAERLLAIEPLPSTRGRESVVLVEADDVVRKMVAGILTADGYRVAAARSPAAARREVRRLPKPAQLLIASLTSEGEKLARALHAAEPGLRILCTTSSEHAPPLGWLRRRHRAYLPKPYALSELLKRARAVLDA